MTRLTIAVRSPWEHQCLRVCLGCCQHPPSPGITAVSPHRQTPHTHPATGTGTTGGLRDHGGAQGHNRLSPSRCYSCYLGNGVAARCAPCDVAGPGGAEEGSLGHQVHHLHGRVTIRAHSRRSTADNRRSMEQFFHSVELFVILF